MVPAWDGYASFHVVCLLFVVVIVIVCLKMDCGYGDFVYLTSDSSMAFFSEKPVVTILENIFKIEFFSCSNEPFYLFKQQVFL